MADHITRRKFMKNGAIMLGTLAVSGSMAFETCKETKMSKDKRGKGHQKAKLVRKTLSAHSPQP